MIAKISPGLVVMQPDILRMISGCIDGRLKRFPTALLISSNYVSVAFSSETSLHAYPNLEDFVNYSFVGFIFSVSKDSKKRSTQRRVVAKFQFCNPFIEFWVGWQIHV